MCIIHRVHVLYVLYIKQKKNKNILKLLSASTEIPSKLEPFVFDDSQPVDQEFATVVLGNPTLIGSHLPGPFARDLLQVSKIVAIVNRIFPC